MKKNIGWITMTAVVAASPFAQAWAEDAVPFQACKNVTIVKTEAQKKALEAKGCLASLEHSAPGFGSTLDSSIEAATIGKMLGDVAKDQYLKDLDKRTKYWAETKKCFESSSSSAACKAKVEKIKSQYGNFVGNLRTQLARTNLEKHAVQPELKPFSSKDLPFIPNAFPDAVTGKLQASEFKALNDDVTRNPAKEKDIEAAAKADYTKALSDGIQQNGLYLVAYLPKPSAADAAGKPEWSNAEWAKTIDRLIQDANHEKDVTEKAIAKGTVSFPAVRTSDFIFNWKKDERDLMYYATLTPEMEKYLERNPQNCGLAIAATKWMHNKERDKMVGTMASMFITGGGTAAAATGEIAAVNAVKLGKFGRIVSAGAAVSGGWVGAALTFNDYHTTKDKAEAGFKQLAKIGVEKGKEEDVADPKRYAEAQDAVNHWVRNTAMVQGGFLALGVGASAGPTIAKALVSKSKDAKAGLARWIYKSLNPRKFSDSLETLAAKNAEYRANLGDNLRSHDVAVATELNLATRSTLDTMAKEGDLDPKSLDQVEDLLLGAQDRVAARLEAEGKCRGEACVKPAAEESGKILDDTKKVCSTGKGAK